MAKKRKRKKKLDEEALAERAHDLLLISAVSIGGVYFILGMVSILLGKLIFNTWLCYIILPISLVSFVCGVWGLFSKPKELTWALLIPSLGLLLPLALIVISIITFWPPEIEDGPRRKIHLFGSILHFQDSFLSSPDSDIRRSRSASSPSRFSDPGSGIKPTQVACRVMAGTDSLHFVSKTGSPSTSIRGLTPRPGAFDAAMRPLSRFGAPSAVLRVT